MKTKNIIIIILCLCIIGGAIGATGLIDLSRDEVKKQSGDRFIGVFITTEYLDLFDIDSYIKDNIKDIADGEDIIDTDGNNEYSGRIYAEFIDKSYTVEETGEKAEYGEYVFTSLEGIPLYNCTVYSENGDYSTTVTDDRICDAVFSTNITDEGEEHTLEATVYYSDEKAGHVFYANPVYQDSEGKVYVTSGQGLSVAGEVGYGMETSTSLSGGITKTSSERDGEVTKYSTIVNVKFKYISPVKGIRIVEMNSQSEKIKETSFEDDALPDDYVPQKNTAYILVETVCEDNTERAIYGKYDTSFDTLSTMENGYCKQFSTNITW